MPDWLWIEENPNTRRVELELKHSHPLTHYHS